MKKLWTKLCNQETVFKILMFFLILQPLLEIYILFDERLINIFGFSPSTMIRIFFVGLLSFLSLFVIKWTKKHIWITGYIILVILYSIMHHINALEFVSVDSKGYGYSLVSELFYIIRMIMPLVVLFISYHFEFGEKKLEKVISWLVILISGSIVVTNIIGISLTSYTDYFIKGTIFDWFLPNDFTYKELASKGFFRFANQIAVTEMLITPLILYFFIKKPNKKNAVLVFLQLLATFMIGTKVSTLGFLALLFCMFILYFFFCFIKKELKFSKNVIIYFIIFGGIGLGLLPFSPMLNRSETSSGVQLEATQTKKCIELVFDESNITEYWLREIEKETTDECLSDEALLKKKFEFAEQQLKKIESEEARKHYLETFIAQEYYNRLNPYFVFHSYSYKNDPYFWYDILKLPKATRMENRYVEEAMLKRIKAYNDNPKDNWFGITYTRMTNIYNLERDFISHYYTLGWIGLLLFLSPYLGILGICLLWMVRHFNKKFTLYHCVFALGIGISLFAAFYSGNALDGLLVTLLLGFILGQFLKSILKKEGGFL